MFYVSLNETRQRYHYLKFPVGRGLRNSLSYDIFLKCANVWIFMKNSLHVLQVEYMHVTIVMPSPFVVKEKAVTVCRSEG
jgi:hypothetical protein